MNEPGAAGAEEVAFEVASHPSLPLRPLAKVASGGELSRISLAIQLVAAKESPVGTLVFDEVDSGIGGAVAETVGRSLKKLGSERQVLCVTHLPQVAAQGDEQWSVSKAGGARQGQHRGDASWTARGGSRNWRACWAVRKSPRPPASTPQNCWGSRLTGRSRRQTGRCGQFFLVQSAYSASEWPRSSKPFLRAISLWRFSISRVVELLDAAALQADQVVVVPALVQLEHRLAGLEMLARQQAGLLELRENSVDRGESNVHAFGDQRLVHVLGRQDGAPCSSRTARESGAGAASP